MLIPLDDIILIYQKMLQQLNIDYVSVVIYTGIDIDSLCTLKMLTKFLKSQSIQYKIYPVTTYTQLEERIQQTKAYEQVKLFMFINCGGFIDLSEKWFVNNSNNQNRSRVFLFDINKPINHKNIQSKQILIIDDDHSQFKNMITSDDLKKLEDLEEFDLDDLEEDDEELQDPSNPKSPKRKSQTILTQQLKKHKQGLQRKVKNYYNTTFFSLPTSYCLYSLIRSLNKANNYVLWYAIISMTSLYLDNQMDKQILQTLTSFYRSDMIKFNPQNNEKRQKGEIFTKKGYQFPLMNHWSLYDSMMNSPYLTMKLQLWNDKGVLKLHQILTKIGISLAESKQQYKYMLKQSKQALQQSIFTIAQEYNLIEITYESFMKQTDSASAYLASDYFYLLTAILQKPIHKSTLSQLAEHRLQCFWQAYSVLDGSQQMIRKAVQDYKQTSCLLMKQVKDIIQRDNIITLKLISFANIRCDTKQKRIFQHPSALIRFAYLLMGIQKQKKSSSGKLPFIASLQDVQKGLCTIVGVMNQNRNNIGNRFNNVVTKLGLDVKHDRFMANVMIIGKESLLQFIKELGNNQK